MLSNSDIENASKRGLFRLFNSERKKTQPASVDLHLADVIKIPSFNDDFVLKPWERIPDHYYSEVILHDLEEYHIPPRGNVLGSTKELIAVGKYLAVFFDGKSSLARLFLLVHITAGYVDPGFGRPYDKPRNFMQKLIESLTHLCGIHFEFIEVTEEMGSSITVEIHNLNNCYFAIRSGMPIGQIRLFKLLSPTTSPYGSDGLNSKYTGKASKKVQVSQYEKNF